MAAFSDSEQKKKKRVKRKNPRKVVAVEVSGDMDDRGVVYLSHIPHGFYEPQMRHFFQQFGKVTRLKLWRSKKSGQSRGFAYVEFEYSDVAKIVADTMNNYLMFQKLLKCKFIPNDELCASAFRNSERPFMKPYHRDVSARRHNSLLKAGTARVIKTQKRLVQMEGRRKKKMEALGIECNLPGYTGEWEYIKKARVIVSKERKVEALRQKEIELRKQEALKRAKQKLKLLSKKRRIGKKLRRRAEKEKANQEKPQEPADEKPQEEATQEGSKKSPKRKSSDSQDAAVSSSEAGQSCKKQGRVSTPVSPAREVASSASTSKKDEGEKPPSMSKSRRSYRMLVKSREKPTASPAEKLSPVTPMMTRAATAAAKTTTATPKSAVKNIAKKGSSLSTPKTPAERRKELRTETKTPRGGSKTKTPKKEASSEEVEIEETSTEEEIKIKEFTGIKLPASVKKEVSSKKSDRKQQEISIAGDQLIIF